MADVLIGLQFISYHALNLNEVCKRPFSLLMLSHEVSTSEAPSTLKSLDEVEKRPQTVLICLLLLPLKVIRCIFKKYACAAPTAVKDCQGENECVKE